MLMSIVQNTPSWVWGLLAALLLLGLWQRRTRHVRPAALLALPLTLLAMGLWSMAPGFLAQPLAAVLWLSALLAALWLTQRLPTRRGARWLAAEGRLQLPGSWLPMALILALFGLRYASGAGQALHPEWRSLLAFQAPLALAFGALAGVFLGRALVLLKLARPAAAGRTGEAPSLRNAATFERHMQP